MRELLTRVAPALRVQGFKGSGQNYRRPEAAFIFVINFQGNRLGDNFYVNLGAQPTFIPDDGGAQPDPVRLKEYECVFRKRVGKEWPWTMTDRKFESFMALLDAYQKDFFGRFAGFTAALGIQGFEELVHNFPVIVTKGRAALYFARACLALGNQSKAAEFAKRGLELAGSAEILVADLQAVLSEVDAGANEG